MDIGGYNASSSFNAATGVIGAAQAKSAHTAPKEHRDRHEQEMVKREVELTDRWNKTNIPARHSDPQGFLFT